MNIQKLFMVILIALLSACDAFAETQSDEFNSAITPSYPSGSSPKATNTPDGPDSGPLTTYKRAASNTPSMEGKLNRFDTKSSFIGTEGSNPP